MKPRRKMSYKYVSQFLKKHNCDKDVIEDWLCEDNRIAWEKTLLPKRIIDKEKYYSCYILYGFDYRDALRAKYPEKGMVEITCLLAKYWSIHRDLQDHTWYHYKALFDEMSFVRKNRVDMVARYPDKTPEAIDYLLRDIYAQLKATKTNSDNTP